MNKELRRWYESMYGIFIIRLFTDMFLNLCLTFPKNRSQSHQENMCPKIKYTNR